MKKAFSLIELLIVTAVLGIIAAIAVPLFQQHVEQAKGAAAKDSLRIYRNAIELYAAQHGGVPPGYLKGDTTSQPAGWIALVQLANKTDSHGRLADPNLSDEDYDCGPYLPDLPVNPFNGRIDMIVINESQLFSSAVDGVFGWIYKPTTKDVRLNWLGQDRKGVDYVNY